MFVKHAIKRRETLLGGNSNRTSSMFFPYSYHPRSYNPTTIAYSCLLLGYPQSPLYNYIRLCQPKGPNNHGFLLGSRLKFENRGTARWRGRRSTLIVGVEAWAFPPGGEAEISFSKTSSYTRQSPFRENSPIVFVKRLFATIGY